MVLESIIKPFTAENKPWILIFLGFLYPSLGMFIGMWIFRSYSSLIFVFLATMGAIPLIFNIIQMEEEKDLTDLNERVLIKEHWKALSAFVYLFIGVVLAVVFWYTVLPTSTIDVLFRTQAETISAINGRVTGYAADADIGAFSRIFLNNVKVLVFCILFSFLYGMGALFILIWNASVIGVAIGNFIRSNLALAANLVGAEKIGSYFQTISIGLFRYAIHGIPEIMAYFVAGLAGGIISVAIIKHDMGTRKFEHIVLDSADLLLLAFFILFIAALLEVYVTPVIFG